VGKKWKTYLIVAEKGWVNSERGGRCFEKAAKSVKKWMPKPAVDGEL
jgi:hypothetical protein